MAVLLSAKNGTSTTGSSVGVSLTANVNAGDLLVLIVCGKTTATGFSGGAGTTWTQFGTTQSTSNGLSNIQVWYRTATSSDTSATITVTLSAAASTGIWFNGFRGREGTPILSGLLSTITNSSTTAISTPAWNNTKGQMAFSAVAGNTFSAGSIPTISGTNWSVLFTSANSTISQQDNAVNYLQLGTSNAGCTYTWSSAFTSAVAVQVLVEDPPSSYCTFPLVGLSSGSAKSATSLAIAYPVGIQQGDLLLLWMARDSTLTEPTGWTNIGSINVPSYILLELHAKIATGTETGNLTLSFTSGNMVAQMERWAGPCYGPITNIVTNVQTASGTTAGTSITIPSQSSVSDRAVVAAIGGMRTTTSFNFPSISSNGWLIDGSGIEPSSGPYSIGIFRSIFQGSSAPAGTVVWGTSSTGHAALSVQLYLPLIQYPLFMSM